MIMHNSQQKLSCFSNIACMASRFCQYPAGALCTKNTAATFWIIDDTDFVGAPVHVVALSTWCIECNPQLQKSVKVLEKRYWNDLCRAAQCHARGAGLCLVGVQNHYKTTSSEVTNCASSCAWHFCISVYRNFSTDHTTARQSSRVLLLRQDGRHGAPHSQRAYHFLIYSPYSLDPFGCRVGDRLCCLVVVSSLFHQGRQWNSRPSHREWTRVPT